MRERAFKLIQHLDRDNFLDMSKVRTHIYQESLITDMGLASVQDSALHTKDRHHLFSSNAKLKRHSLSLVKSHETLKDFKFQIPQASLKSGLQVFYTP
jgi:hypothetical protein